MGLKKKLADSQVEINFVPWIPFASTKQFMTIPAKNLRPKVNCEKIYGLFREYYPEYNFKGTMSKFIDDNLKMDYRSETADPTISNAQTDKTNPEKISEEVSVKWTGELCPDISGMYEIKAESHGVPSFEKLRLKSAIAHLQSRFLFNWKVGNDILLKYKCPMQSSILGSN